MNRTPEPGLGIAVGLYSWLKSAGFADREALGVVAGISIASGRVKVAEVVAGDGAMSGGMFDWAGRAVGKARGLVERYRKPVAEAIGSAGEKVSDTVSDVSGKASDAVASGGVLDSLRPYAPHIVSGLGVMAARKLVNGRPMFSAGGLLAGILGGAAGGYAYRNRDTLIPRANAAIDEGQERLSGLVSGRVPELNRDKPSAGAAGTTDSPSAAR